MASIKQLKIQFNSAFQFQNSNVNYNIFYFSIRKRIFLVYSFTPGITLYLDSGHIFTSTENKISFFLTVLHN